MLDALPDDFLAIYWTLLVILAYLLVFVIVWIVLWARGTLRELFTIGSVKIRGQLRLRRLNRARDLTRKMRASAEQDLGSKVWEMSIEDPAYQDLYQQLQQIEQRRDAVEVEVEEQEAEMQRATRRRNRTRADFAYKLSLERQKRKAASTRLSGVKAEMRGLKRKIKSTERKRKRAVSALVSSRKKQQRMAAKSSAKQEKRLALLDQEVTARREMIVLLEERTRKLQNQVTELPALQQSIEEEIAAYDARVGEIEAQQAEVLAPLDASVAGLAAAVRAAKETLMESQEQMNPLLQTLGASVHQARPPASILVTDLARLDSLQANEDELTNHIDLLKGQLEELGVVNVQRFYLLVLYLLVAIAGVLAILRKL